MMIREGMNRIGSGPFHTTRSLHVEASALGQNWRRSPLTPAGANFCSNRMAVYPHKPRTA